MFYNQTIALEIIHAKCDGQACGFQGELSDFLQQLMDQSEKDSVKRYFETYLFASRGTRGMPISTLNVRPLRRKCMERT